MKVGIVVIGRNEGERLAPALRSALAAGVPVLYVDSASGDGSAARARALGVTVLELEPPLSAGRARNAGAASLLGAHPELRYIQFLDGDSVLAPGWVGRAAAALDEHPQYGGVIGQLFERNAEASAYNRLCALEWRGGTPGSSLGGIAMLRVEVFRALGGFRAEVIAGEDSELGVRMALAGYSVRKIDAAMATHDADMTRFRQWWTRAVRGGHAIGQRFELNGRPPARDCARERASTLFWGVGLPLAVAATAIPTGGASLGLLLAYPALAVRVWRYRRRMGDHSSDALLYAAFIVPTKFANALGLLRFYANRIANRYRLIEYK
jgi:GT2 family glycosyltransferase